MSSIVFQKLAANAASASERQPFVRSLTKLCQETFALREPLWKSLGSEPKDLFFVPYVVSGAMEGGISFFAYDSAATGEFEEDTGKPVGYCFMFDQYEEPAPEPEGEAPLTKKTNPHPIPRFLTELSSGIPDAKPSAANTVCSVGLVGVADGYAGRGIALKLQEMALEAAKEKGFKVAVSEASNSGTIHMFLNRLGFEEVRRMDPKSWQIEDGSCPFAKVPENSPVVFVRKDL